MQITGIIITLNEADNVTACVQSLQRICDEIIVVDSMSEDETVELAEAAGARAIKQAYLGDGPQKPMGCHTQKMTGSWRLMPMSAWTMTPLS